MILESINRPSRLSLATLLEINLLFALIINSVTHLWVLVVGQVEDVLDEGVNVHHEGLRAADDELVHAGDGVRPDLGAAVLEELQELGHEHVERPVDLVLEAIV